MDARFRIALAAATIGIAAHATGAEITSSDARSSAPRDETAQTLTEEQTRDRMQQIAGEIRARRAQANRLREATGAAALPPPDNPPAVEPGSAPEVTGLTDEERRERIRRQIADLRRKREESLTRADGSGPQRIVLRDIPAVELVAFLARKIDAPVQVHGTLPPALVTLVCPADLGVTELQAGIAELLRLRGIKLSSPPGAGLRLEDMEDPSAALAEALAARPLAQRLPATLARDFGSDLITLAWQDFPATSVVGFMGLLCDRAVLFDDFLPNVVFAIEETTMTRTDAIERIDAALRARGMFVYESGDAFLGVCCEPLSPPSP